MRTKHDRGKQVSLQRPEKVATEASVRRRRKSEPENSPPRAQRLLRGLLCRAVTLFLLNLTGASLFIFSLR